MNNLKLKRNIILPLLLILISAIIGFLFVFNGNVSTAKAEETVETHGYFSRYTAEDVLLDDKAILDGSNLNVSIPANGKAVFKRNLEISAAEFSFVMPTDVDSFSVTFTTKNEDVNAEDNNDVIEFRKVSTGYEVFVNDVTTGTTITGTDCTFSTSSDAIIVDSVPVTAFVGSNKNDGLSAKVTLSSSQDLTLSIKSIDQNTNAGSNEFKQTFNLVNGEIQTTAYPVVKIADGLVKFEAGKAIFRWAEKTNVKYTVYSVTPNTVNSSSVKMIGDLTDADKLIYEGNSVRFTEKNSTVSVALVNASDNTKRYNEYSVSVVEDDGVAPVFTADATAISNFVTKLQASTKQKYQTENGEIEASVRLGSGQYLTLPSMSAFVADEQIGYDSLDYTVYYRTDSVSSWQTTSNYKIPLGSADTYTFFVLFSDGVNKMEKDDVLDEDGNVINDEYVFSFEVLDNAPMQVESTTQEKAYKDVRLTLKDFKITAVDYTVEYRLYYSETNSTDESAWTKIETLSDVNKDDDNYEYFADVNYDGKLTFTPDKFGYYKVECAVYSNNYTTRSVTASAVVEVLDAPKVVEPDNEWLENNVLSIVFLGVGAVAFIAILVLLFIKPKDQVSKK